MRPTVAVPLWWVLVPVSKHIRVFFGVIYSPTRRKQQIISTTACFKKCMLARYQGEVGSLGGCGFFLCSPCAVQNDTEVAGIGRLAATRTLADDDLLLIKVSQGG